MDQNVSYQVNCTIFGYISDDEPKAHFIRPESYQVTWWPGDHPEDDIQSDSTTGESFLYSNITVKILKIWTRGKLL